MMRQLSWSIALAALLLGPALAQTPDTPAMPKTPPVAAPTPDAEDTPEAPAEPAGPPPAKGPPPAIKMQCAPNPVRIGERLVCTLTAVHRADVSIEVTAPERFEVGEPTPAKTRDDGLLETVRALTVRPDSMRKVRVRGLQVVYTEASGGQGTMAVPDQIVPTRSVIAGTDQPTFRTFETPGGGVEGQDGPNVADGYFARHGPLPYRVFNWPLFIALCVLGGVGLGIGVGVLVKRYLDARRIDPGPPVDPRPAHVIAYAELEALLALNLPADGRVGEFYVRLSEIVRRYLGRRFGIDAPEMTSDQIRAWATLQGERFGAEVRLGLDDFLAETDLVKFADFSPTESEISTVTRQARGLISLTRVPDAGGEPSAPAPSAPAAEPPASKHAPAEPPVSLEKGDDA